MTTVSVSEFAARADELLKCAESGETVLIQRNGRAVVRLEPNSTPATRLLAAIAQIEESEDEKTDDILSGNIPREPLTEFSFTSATITLEQRQPDLNLSWFLPQAVDLPT